MLVELLNAKFDGIAGETSFPVDEIDGVEDLMDHELLLVGCPTWFCRRFLQCNEWLQSASY